MVFIKASRRIFFFSPKTRTVLEVCHLGIRETMPAAMVDCVKIQIFVNSHLDGDLELLSHVRNCGPHFE